MQSMQKIQRLLHSRKIFIKLLLHVKNDMRSLLKLIFYILLLSNHYLFFYDS